jgi:hypothetical protein
MQSHTEVSNYDQLFKGREISDLMPFIQFPPEWLIAVIPPFAGASVRFLVTTSAIKELDKGWRISVYSDFFQDLGCYGNNPYWEAYGQCKEWNDPERFALNDIAGLINWISNCLQSYYNELQQGQREI